MSPRTETVDTLIYRSEKDREVLCRLTYEVRPLREGVLRWFLVNIEELE